MKRILVVSAIVMLAVVVDARSFMDGHFVVTLASKDHQPITNATVYVKTLNRCGLGAGAYENHYTTFSAQTDTSGVADVQFRFLSSHFDWWLDTPSHYSSGIGYRDDHLNPTVVPSDYWDLNTNTVDGLTKYNELKALDEAGDYAAYAEKFEPKSITYASNSIHRSFSFYPKRNPQPMYFHVDTFRHFLPMKNFMTETNDSVEVLHYRTVDFDMKIGRFLPPWGGRNDSDPGEVSDFRIVRDAFTTNGVAVRSGRLEFAPGCGAYRGTMPNDDGHFQGFYEADTNALFSSQIPFEQRLVNGKWKDAIPLLATNEYMVLRTRVMTNEVGVVTNCHYSTILGRMDAPWRKLTFDQMIFNQRSNDPNLEFDGHNLDE